ncbi:MAG: 50S ribosomal protein L29 [Acidobacteria bacterium]|nr:50S ribosomal protein L29 [Acidobacteriota bacterium]
MKASDLREKGIDELREQEKSLAHQLFKYRMELATGQLTNTQVLRLAKRDLAKVKTVIREKELNIR